jgi:CopG family nickel-responsive transcriptional regulator
MNVSVHDVPSDHFILYNTDNSEVVRHMLTRFGVSLENDLLDRFDALIGEKGYKNRSEAIRDLIRDALVKREWLEADVETIGAVIIVYNHHQYDLSQKLAFSQHQHVEHIVSSLHVHLDEHNCLEVILLKGKAKEIKHVADKIVSTKGVKFGQFVPATAGKTF